MSGWQLTASAQAPRVLRRNRLSEHLLIAKAMTKTYITMEFVSYSGQVLFSCAFIALYGTVGATIGYAVGNLLYFVIMVINFRKILFNYE